MCLKRLILGLYLGAVLSAAPAGNIDPENNGSKYAYGQNVGWLNFKPQQGPGVHVSSAKVEGFVWAENIGWINLSPGYGGVVNDGAGRLSGYAWGENVGWINFAPNYGGVTIDDAGEFDGWAWGQNIGWINFNSTDLDDYNVKACKVTIRDLANFVDNWLDTGLDIPGDLNRNTEVDYADFSIFADHWLDYCTNAWNLK